MTAVVRKQMCQLCGEWFRSVSQHLAQSKRRQLPCGDVHKYYTYHF